MLDSPLNSHFDLVANTGRRQAEIACGPSIFRLLFTATGLQVKLCTVMPALTPKESLRRNDCNISRLTDQRQRLSVMKLKILLASFRSSRSRTTSHSPPPPNSCFTL